MNRDASDEKEEEVMSEQCGCRRFVSTRDLDVIHARFALKIKTLRWMKRWVSLLLLWDECFYIFYTNNRSNKNCDDFNFFFFPQLMIEMGNSRYWLLEGTGWASEVKTVSIIISQGGENWKVARSMENETENNLSLFLSPLIYDELCS
jgi:hypothetical protein